MARILRALDISTKLLTDYYLGLDRTAKPPARDAPMPPHFQCFTSGEITYKLTYTHRMLQEQPNKAVFVASVEPPKEEGEPDFVVVKFTRSYCKDAHMLLAQESLAPDLRYCEMVESIGMYVVVMDFVFGDYPEAPFQNWGFTEKLRTAIQTLHDKDFVHGDIREGNILVSEDGNVKVIDFDWCRKVGEARYPSDINLDLPWHPDVARGGLIKKEHDQNMFLRLTGAEWET